jgi:ubiquitin-activating enzyme E1 C
MVDTDLSTRFQRLTLARRKYLDNILNRLGPFTDPDWEPGEAVVEGLSRAKIL